MNRRCSRLLDGASNFSVGCNAIWRASAVPGYCLPGRFFCYSSFICADDGGQAAVIIYAVQHDVRGDGVVGSTTTISIGVVCDGVAVFV